MRRLDSETNKQRQGETELKKSTLIVAAAVLVSAPAYAVKCYDGEMGFNELVYSSEEELRAEYCAAMGFSDLYLKFMREDTDRGRIPPREYSNRVSGCVNYSGQINKVLKKEYNVPIGSVKCEK